MCRAFVQPRMLTCLFSAVRMGTHKWLRIYIWSDRSVFVRIARLLSLFTLCSLAATLAAACVAGTPVPLVQNPPTPNVRPVAPTVAPSAAPIATPAATPTIAPTISLNPAAGGPRTQVTIVVSGFPARTPVSLLLALPNTGVAAQSVGEVVTDEQGKVSIVFVMPDRWPGGALITEKELMFVVGDVSSGIKATALFNFQPGVAVQPSPTPTPRSEPSAYISFKWLNVRSGPGNAFNLVTRIEQGETISLLGRNADGSWVQVRLPGSQLGWVPAPYIEANIPIASLPIVSGEGGLTPPELGNELAAYVIRRSANMHSGPGLNYSLIKSLERDQVMDLLGRNPDGSWVQMRLPDGQQGWVSAISIEASVPISNLPVTSNLVVTPTPGEFPSEPTVYTAAGPLEVYSGPGADYRLIVVTAISRDQGMSLLGRNAEGSWVEVRLPDGSLGWVTSASIRANLPITNLAVIAGPQPRVLLNNLAVRSAMPLQVNVEGFLSNQDIVVTLGLPDTSRGLTVARGTTDAKGAAQLVFAVPGLWADGSPIVENALTLVVRSLDGSVSKSVNLQYLK